MPVVMSPDTVTAPALLKVIFAAGPDPGPVTLATVMWFDVPVPA